MAENVFFTADTHFGHERLLTLGRGRPFSSAEAMTEALVERWNERVRRNDRIYHLGDLSFLNRGRTEQVLSRLNGQIHVVRGNHDHTLDRLQGRFASYQQYKEIKVGTRRLVLFHFPVLSWHHANRGAWHLHGHCHGTLAEDPAVPRMDVGVDCTGFAPISFEEVAGHLSGREWRPIDHHRSEPSDAPPS
ncbi:MAG: metallophosphoesterase family protein [Actinomycetota bacterium]|nr:metallophosphoesterase family protein [Actinomycetota bacterium]